MISAVAADLTPVKLSVRPVSVALADDELRVALMASLSSEQFVKGPIFLMLKL